jgi:hypothetical protein
MKKFALVFIMLFTAGFLLADDIAIAGQTPTPTGAKTIIVYDPVKHTETASNIFLLWGGASAAIGISTMFNSNTTTKGFGIGMIAYGIAETAMAIYNVNYGEKITDPAKAQAAMIDKSGLHSVLGIVQMAAGGALAAFGDSNTKGYGIAIALQGGFFSIYDGMDYFIAKNPGTVRDWNAGVTYRVKLASMDFYAR